VFDSVRKFAKTARQLAPELEVDAHSLGVGHAHPRRDATETNIMKSLLSSSSKNEMS
jgi:hypothetical protein